MKIYINGVEIKSEVLPTDTPTLDETLETFSFVLMLNNQPRAFAPMQEVKFDLENTENEKVILVLVSDNVEVASTYPLKYKHSITCVQNTRKLTKNTVRNSVFTQPADKFKRSFNATSAFIDSSGWDDINYQVKLLPAENAGQTAYNNLNKASEMMPLRPKETCTKATIKIGLQVAICNAATGSYPSNATMYSQLKTYADLQALVPSANLTFPTATGFYLHYKLDGIYYTVNITPASFGLSEFLFNTELEFPYLKEKINEGATEIELEFINDVFIEGRMYPRSSSFIMFYGVQLEAIAETFYYSCYDIIDLLIKRQKKEYNDFSSEVPFSLPTDIDNETYKVLKSKAAPNFTFTQLTMYECVAEVFRLFDAIFTMDENGVLEIEYFNDLSGNVLNNPKFASMNKAISEDKFTNGLITYYQDARQEESFPNNNTFAPLRSAEFGVPESQDHNFIVPHPIQSIVKAEALIEDMSVLYFTGTETYLSFNENFALDISRYVVTQAIYSLLNENLSWGNNPNQIYKTNTVYFAEGDNKIQVGAVKKTGWGFLQYPLQNALKSAFFTSLGWNASPQPLNTGFVTFYVPGTSTILNENWYAYRMRVTYNASINGKTQMESLKNKYPGETLVDQVNGAVDLNALGVNVLGLSLKFGEPSLNVIQKISSWKKRIKTGTLYYDDLGDLWIANVCSYTIYGDKIQASVSFVKNFNALQLRTRLLREKRMSNISNNLIQKSEETLIEYMYYTSVLPEQAVLDIWESSITKNMLFYSMLATFTYVTQPISIGDAVVENENGDFFIIPSIRYGFGNSICFEISYNHPMSAGNQTTYGKYSTTFNLAKYFTESVNYTDDEGFLETINIYFAGGLVDYNATYDENYPAVSDPINYAITIENYKVYKQPNEIFALNYQVVFLPQDLNVDFIGPEFMNNQFLVTNKKSVKKFYLYYANDDFKYSVLDFEGHLGNKTEITNVYIYPTINTLQFQFNNTGIGTFKNWAICDENGKIYFASNTTPNGISYGYVSIYFYGRKERIDVINDYGEAIKLI